MGIKRRYKNIVEKFLSKDQGKRFFQFFYSWGAAVVIIGALAKLMHWPYNLGNILLSVGMITEFFVFFISAFDRPPKEYKWEEVFPILDSKDPEDRPLFKGGNGGGGFGVAGGGVAVDGEEAGIAGVSGGGSGGGGTVIIGGGGVAASAGGVAPEGGIVGGMSGPVILGGGAGGYGGGGFAGGGYAGGATGHPVAGADGEEIEIPLTQGQIKKSFGIPSNVDISEEDTNALTASIKKLSGAAEQLSKMSELTDATQQYLDQISQMSENMQKFSQVTNNLTDVSDVLLNSYKSITDNSDELTENSKGYIHQMEALNRNISTLNNIYELQMHSVSSQMEAVNRINAGLSRIKEMYEGSVVDSTVFRGETEKMTQHIAALNTVYARLLNAMTMNMNVQGAAMGYNPNPGYAPGGYAPNPGYNPNPGYYNPGYTPPQTGVNNPKPAENNEKQP